MAGLALAGKGLEERAKRRRTPALVARLLGLAVLLLALLPGFAWGQDGVFFQVDSFAVTIKAPHVAVITWSTSQQVNVASYRLYRVSSDPTLNGWVNRLDVVAGADGQKYNLIDSGLAPGEGFQYLLYGYPPGGPGPDFHFVEIPHPFAVHALYMPAISSQ